MKESHLKGIWTKIWFMHVTFILLFSNSHHVDLVTISYLMYACDIYPIVKQQSSRGFSENIIFRNVSKNNQFCKTTVEGFLILQFSDKIALHEVWLIKLISPFSSLLLYVFFPCLFRLFLVLNSLYLYFVFCFPILCLILFLFKTKHFYILFSPLNSFFFYSAATGENLLNPLEISKKTEGRTPKRSHLRPIEHQTQLQICILKWV